jgi:outer membrane protein insertion porin family
MKIILLVFIQIILFYSQNVNSQYFLEDSKIPIIEKLTEKYKNKSLNIKQLDDIVKELSTDGLFQILAVETLGDNKVVIRGEASAKINEILVEGSNSFTEDEVIEKMDLKIGQIYSQLELNQAVDKVKKYYRNSGFYNFNISTSKAPLDDGFAFKIIIDEKDYCIIEDIKVFSKNTELNRIIEQTISDYKNSNYQQDTAKSIEKIITEFLLSHRYLTSKVTNSRTLFNEPKTKVKLNFTIENPTQFEFIFHGNNYFSHFDLIKVSKIGGKFLYLSDSSSEIIENITTHYLEAGFPQISIQFSEKNFEDLGKKVLVFNITEGPRIRIGRVEISGKLSRPKSYYLKLFNQFLAEQAHSVYYVKDDIQRTADSLITQLQREGHLVADLLSLTIDFTKYNNANINIQIDEGILTYVRQILFRGSKSFSNIELREQIEIEPNKPLKIEQIETSFDKLSQFYKERAYLDFTIKNQNASVIQYTQGQPYADIVYQIEEGPKVKVKDIIVNGNTKTKDYVILRELDFENGDLLTLSKVNNSITQLEKTGLFGKVVIKSVEQNTQVSERTIVIDIEERRPGLFSSGIGLVNAGKLIYRGYVGMIYNNLWGRARALSSRVDLQYQEKVKYLENRIAVSYYEPYLNNNRLRGRISLIRQQELSELNQLNEAFIRSTNQIRFTTEKDFSKETRLTYDVWSFSNQETFAVTDLKTQGTINIGSTGPTFEYDLRNDPFIPTSGSYTKIDFKYADPLLGGSRDNPNVTGVNAQGKRNDSKNEIKFFKTTLSTNLYTPLSNNNRWVWANSFRGGYLRNVSGRSDSGVPRVESFFLGGSSTIRGFTSGTIESTPGKRELCLAQKQIQPGQVTSDCKFDSIFVRNDSVFFLLKSELRFPITGNFGGLVFYDGGAVYLGEFKLNDPYRDSVGMGFRYDTPVGSFVVEIGYKLDRKLGGLTTLYDKESDFALHLSIGTF